MNETQIHLLCTQLQLGEPRAALQAARGGPLHRMWHLTTTQGSFAIKQLHPAILYTPDIRDSYNRSEQIAATLASHAIPAVVAFARNGNYVQHIDEHMLLVYPWIEGETLALSAVEPDQAQQIGTILAHIHALDVHIPNLHAPEWETVPADDWDMLTFHASDLDVPWAGTVRAALPEITTWSRWMSAAYPQLNQKLVVSHRHLHQQQVLWRDRKQPAIIDWEAAGLVNPTVELLGAALSWSGQTQGAPHEATFRALLAAYQEAGGTMHADGQDALYGLMSHWLNWLLFHMRRSLGEATSNEDERTASAGEAAATLTILRNLAHYGHLWVRWLDQSH